MLKQAIPYYLIKDCCDSNNLDTLRVWMLMIKAYRNRVFYNYTLRSIANKIGINKETVRKHLPFLFRLNLIRQQGKNLAIVGINKIKKKSHCVLVPIAKDKSTQIAQLRFALLKNNFDKQARKVKNKSKIVQIAKTNAKPTREQRKIIAQGGGLDKTVQQIRKDGNLCITLSNKSFGGKLNRSRSTGRRIQKQLNKLKLVKSTYRFILVKANAHIRDFMDNYYGRGYVYTNNGNIIKQLSNAIVMQ